MRAAAATSPPAASKQQSSAELAASIAARKQQEADEAAARVAARKQALRDAERAAEVEANERDGLKASVARRVMQRARGKTFADLLREFAPAIHADLKLPLAPGAAGLDTLRKAMRKALARFHPDKHTQSPLKNKVEAEEVFVVIKKAYDELNTLCNNSR